MAKISKGYLKRKIAIKGSRKHPLSAKNILNKYSYHYGRMSEEEKEKIKEQYDIYDLSFLTPKELRKNKDFSIEEKRFLAERFFGFVSGKYQEAKKNIYLSNYRDALKQAGVSDKVRQNVMRVLRKKDPTELSMMIRNGIIPNAFIFYETQDEGERAILLEEDLKTFLKEEKENEKRAKKAR